VTARLDALVAWARARPARAFGLLAALFVLGLFGPALLGIDTLFMDDLHRYELHQHLTTARALGEGRLPAWSPHLHLGLPHLANPTAAVFYPLTWLEAVAPVLWSINARVALHLWMAALFTFLLARRLGTSAWGAGLAGAGFALSGPAVSYAGNPFYLASLAWTPLVLIGVLEVMESRRLRSVALLAGAITLQLLAGDPQALVISALWALGLSLARAPALPDARTRARALALLAAAAGLAALMSAAQWLPTLSYLQASVRSAGAAPVEVLVTWSLHPLRLLATVIPDLFGAPVPENSAWAFPLMHDARFWFHSIYLGAFVVPLAFLGLRTRCGLALGLLALLFTALAMGDRLPLLGWLVDLAPPFGWFRYPEKYMAHVALAVPLLAGLGLDRARGERGAFGRTGALALGLGLTMIVATQTPWLAAWIEAWSPVPNVDGALAAMNRGGAGVAFAGVVVLAGGYLVFALEGERRRAAVMSGLVVLAAAADLARAHAPLLATADARLLDAEVSLGALLSERVGARGGRVLRDPSLEHVRLHKDQAGLVMEVARRRAAVSSDVAVSEGLERVAGYSAALPDGLAELQARVFDDFDRVTALLDVGYLLLPIGPIGPRVRGWLEGGQLRPLAEDRQAGVALYELTREPARAWCESLSGARLSRDACRRVRWGDDWAEIEVGVTAPARLVRSVSYVPGWEASSARGALEVERVHGALQAVEVGPEVKRVRFEYTPPGLGWGLGLSGVGLVLLACVFVLSRRRTAM
jgi:hypothetical protein